MVRLNEAAVGAPVVDLAPYARAGSATPCVALVDPRELTRHCLARWLQEAWPGCSVVAVAKTRDLTEPLRRPTRMHFALLAVPAGQVLSPETLAAITQLHRLLGDRPIIVLAEGEEPEEVLAAIRAGARGYVPTSLDRAAALEAIRFVLAGGTFVPAGALAKDTNGAAVGPSRLTGTPQLSPRELEIASCLREGKPNKLIAYELAISESTVKVFVRRILAKLGVTNRTEAAILLERHLLGSPQDIGRSDLPDPLPAN